MKKFLVKGCVFFIGLNIVDVLLLCILLSLCTYFRSEEYGIAKNLPQTDVLIMGSSHAQESFNPKSLEEKTPWTFYNLGRARRNVYFNEYYSKFIYSQGHHPKAVVLTISYNDLRETSRPYMVPQFVEDKRYFPLLYSFLMQKQWTQIRGFFYADLFSSSYRMTCSRMISWLKNKSRDVPYFPDQSKGYRPDGTQLRAGPRPNSFAKYPYKVFDFQKESFERLLQFWQSKNVPVYVLDTPEFAGSRLSALEYDKYVETISSIAKNNGAIFKSFNDPTKDWVQNSKNFRDGGWGRPNSHMNINGIQYFEKEFLQWFKLNEK